MNTKGLDSYIADILVGDVKEVARSLPKKLDLSHQPLLLQALFAESLPIMELLLKRGIKPTHFELGWAIRRHNLEAVKLLLRNGARPDSLKPSLRARLVEWSLQERDISPYLL